MKVFIIGVSGAVGSRLARILTARGDEVSGLVRTAEQRDQLATEGVDAYVGSLSELSSRLLTPLLIGVEVLVFAAGSNGGAREITDAIDGVGVLTALEASRRARVARFVSVSVLPEAAREEELGEDEEHYFAVKKAADIAVARSGLDWLVLRPSRLTDSPGGGTVSLSAAEAHGEISRDDVAATLAALIQEPRVFRQILELDGGASAIPDAVQANIR
ncbi:MAG: NAD(P)H-binding protein [Actinomycetota bacterium]